MTRLTYSAAAIIAAVILSFCLFTPGQAAVPDSLNYQGYLTDASGAAIEGSTEMMFTIYSDATSGAPLWSSAFIVVPVDQGLFSVQLGGLANHFSPALFNTPLWLGVTIRGEAEMVPRRPLTTVGFAFKADDALTLTGHSAAALDQSDHVADTDNPHRVASAQIGATASVDFDNHAAATDAHHVRYTNPEAVAALQAHGGAGVNADTLDGNDSGFFATGAAVASQLADIWAELVTLRGDVTQLQARNDVLENLLQHVSRNGNDLYVTGANLHILSGSGATDGVVNGLGNLVVGYNALDVNDSPICSLGEFESELACESNGGLWAGSHRSGSHNLVIGDYHNYSRHSGIVAGLDNNITGRWSSVSGGLFNTAGGDYATVSGGRVNSAIGNFSSVSGGGINSATGERSSVSGGYSNTASGEKSSVSGGRNNTAEGEYASVVGGGSDNPALGNHAYAEYSSILGGISNVTGDPGSGDTTLGTTSVVSGGDANRATGAYATVSGGSENLARGEAASVSAGMLNTASGVNASVSGGVLNTASGLHASVVGGGQNVAEGGASSVLGGGSDLPSLAIMPMLTFRRSSAASTMWLAIRIAVI